MRSAREWNLVLAGLLLGVLLGLPATASPINPKLPSTLNFQPLNVIPVPSTEADWSFEMGHLDMVVVSDHLSGLRARNSDVALLSYQLLHSVLISDTAEQNQLAAIATARSADVEDAFLHFYDDTTVTYGNGTTVTIKGYGGGTAATLKEARVRNMIWTDERYVYNLKSPLLRELKGTQYRSVITSALKPDGVFVDESSPLVAFIPTPVSGGHLREYANKTREEASAEYALDMAAAFAAVNETMGHDGPFGDRYLIPNVSEWVDGSLELGLHGADGVATEVYIQETQPRSQHLYDLAKQFADAGKIFLVTQGGYTPTFTGPGNYSSTMDRHQMYGLTDYWIAKQGKSTYYSQYPSGYLAVSQWWCKARDFDVGVPVDAMYSVWKTGTDSVNQTYTIYKRQYSKALMLSRPKVGWTFDDYNTLCAPYDLGGTYKLLHYDGTLGPEITKIGLAMGEAVTLLSTTGGALPPDTTPPVISGVTSSAVTSNSATIAWTTDEPATGSVEYGPTTAYGSSTQAANAVTSQSIPLAGLVADRLYHYRVTAMDAAGNRSVGADNTFTTAAPTGGGGGGTPAPGSGYIRHWAALGSFGYTSGQGHNTDYIGETTVKPSVGDTTAGKVWTDFQSATDQLDLYPLFTPNSYAVAYLNVYVNSPTQRDCQLRLGVDDAAKAFLNGVMVDDYVAYRPADPDTDKVGVTLTSGWNQLLVKMQNYTAGWSAYVRFTDASGNALSDLTYQLNAPIVASAGTPKIGVSITVDKPTAKVGQQLTYTVTYTNTGDGPATSAVVSAGVDSHVTFVGATGGGAYDPAAKVVRWNVGTVQPGASASVRYTVAVK